MQTFVCHNPNQNRFSVEGKLKSIVTLRWKCGSSLKRCHDQLRFRISIQSNQIHIDNYANMTRNLVQLLQSWIHTLYIFSDPNLSCYCMTKPLSTITNFHGSYCGSSSAFGEQARSTQKIICHLICRNRLSLGHLVPPKFGIGFWELRQHQLHHHY